MYVQYYVCLVNIYNIFKGSFPFTLISYNVTLVDRIVTIVLSNFEYSHVMSMMYSITL